LLTAIHEAEAALRESGERAGTVGQELIESADGGAHESNFTLAPALIAAQNAQGARIFALATGIKDQLRENRCIKQAQVDALAGQRMYNMRGIANERTSVRDIAVCCEPLQRQSKAIALQAGAAQRVVGSPIQLNLEFRVGQPGQLGC